MITVTMRRTITADGQSVTEEVTVTGEFPSGNDSQTVQQINKLKEGIVSTTERIKQADEKNKPVT